MNIFIFHTQNKFFSRTKYAKSNYKNVYFLKPQILEKIELIKSVQTHTFNEPIGYW